MLAVFLVFVVSNIFNVFRIRAQLATRGVYAADVLTQIEGNRYMTSYGTLLSYWEYIMFGVLHVMLLSQVCHA